MSHNTSTYVSSQDPDTHYNATTSRLPLSGIQILHRPINVNIWKSQALLQSVMPLIVNFEDLVSPRISPLIPSQRESARSILRTRANHVQPRLQITPTLHQDINTDSHNHNQASHEVLQTCFTASGLFHSRFLLPTVVLTARPSQRHL